MLKTGSILQVIIIILTTLCTVSTAWIYSSRSTIERTIAVWTTLTSITIVLTIEIFYHFFYPRPKELTMPGGVAVECIFLGFLVLYEWIPTLCRLDRYEGNARILSMELILIKAFATLGVLTAVSTLAVWRLTIVEDLEMTAQSFNGYGMLFIIPALGVGEAFMMRWGSGGGMLACTILCTPIIYLVLYYFDLLTALTYISTAMAFFSDAIFGCRHFLKIRYQQENSGEQEMGQV